MTPRPRNATFAIVLSPKSFLECLTALGQPDHNTERLYSIRCWPRAKASAVDADNLKRGTAMEDNKSKALAAALAQIEKQYGKGSIMRMDAEAVKDIEV